MTDMKEQKPLVSIALCTYNGERYLQQQLNSLAVQNYTCLEIIIVDDCSTDKSFDILRKFQMGNPKVKLHRNEENIGFVKNFSKAISLCTGDYIALCDQDDVWFSDKISKLVAAIGEGDLVYSSVRLIDSHGVELNEIFPRRNKLYGRCYLGLLLSNCITGHASLVKRSVTNRALPFPQHVKVHDHWLALVAATGKGIVYHDEVLSLYRKHSDNALLRNKRRKNKDKVKRFRKKREMLIGFIQAVLELPGIDNRDRKLIRDLLESLQPTLLIPNVKLRRILMENANELLALYPDPYKVVKNLCQPLIKTVI